jgi:hypothetical protein
MAERKQDREESQGRKEPRRARHVQFAEVVFSALYGKQAGNISLRLRVPIPEDQQPACTGKRDSHGRYKI